MSRSDCARFTAQTSRAVISSDTEGISVTEDINSDRIKIGELLISVGLLSSGDLTEAIQIAKRMGVPIGRVLVMSGCVTEAGLQQALKLQSLVKDGLVDIDTGIDALKKVFREKIELEDALKTFNWQPAKDVAGNKLGDLLVDSTMVTRGQLDRALEASFQSGMPLGGTLVLQGVLSPMLLPTVLHAQEQIRDGKMTREEAVGELRMALMYWAKAGESKQDELETFPGAAKPAAKAPVPSPAPAPQAPVPAPAPHMAPSAVQHSPADEATRPQQFVHPSQQSGMATQMAQTPYTSPNNNNAPPAVAQAQGTTGDANRGNAAMQNPAPDQQNVVSLVELLKLSGMCTQASLEQSIKDALEDNRVASKVLLAVGILDSEMLNTCVRCQALIARGILRTDQVLYALNSIRHRKVTLEQAVAELGVQVPV
jgi:hypothetical protein